jgi:hypothetical protein
MAPEQISDGRSRQRPTCTRAGGRGRAPFRRASRGRPEIVVRCLREDPSERFPDAGALATRSRRPRATDRAAAPPDQDAVPNDRGRSHRPSRSSRPRTAATVLRGPRRRGARLAAGLGVLALAIAGAAVVLGSGGSDSPSSANSAAQRPRRPSRYPSRARKTRLPRPVSSPTSFGPSPERRARAAARPAGGRGTPGCGGRRGGSRHGGGRGGDRGVAVVGG